jgi:RNA polymerase sigma-70 factor, ECF subfamily
MSPDQGISRGQPNLKCAVRGWSWLAPLKGVRLALSDFDRELVQRCLTRQPRAWEDFVDRFLGLVIHVVNHTSHARSIAVSPEDLEDLAAEVFAAILEDDFAVLRRFRGQSSLATYLTVIARRAVVRELLKRRIVPNLGGADVEDVEDESAAAEERLSNREEVERLLDELRGEEADIVRMYHLEGQSYQEISQRIGIPENSVGPALSRARAKMRRQGVDAAASP